jgi:hypothetical protein
MPGAFHLQLDTQAPVVTWGPVTDPNAGEDMTVLYSLNEPALDHATFTLIDGRELPMVDLGDRLTVHLPDDAPDGAAVVRAYVVDSVLNAATRTLTVVVGGVPYTPPPPPAPDTQGGFPGTRPRPAPTLIRSSSSCQTGSRPDRIVVRQHTSTSARPRVRYTAPSQRTIRQRTSARSASSARLAATVPFVSSAAVTGGTATLWKRPEGPGAEDDLILLGLL